MLKIYRRKLILGLLSLEVVFALIFVFALINNIHGRGILGTGLKYTVENTIIMVLSILSMINVIYEIFKVK